MTSALNWFRAKKMWVGGAVAAVMQYLDLLRSILADENVSFDEAETAVRAGMALVTTILVMIGIYKPTNEEPPTVQFANPPSPPAS